MLLRRLALTPLAGVAGAVLAAVLAVGLAGAGPAAAAVTGSTSSRDVVLRNQCQDHAIRYEVQVDPGTAAWNLDITVARPDGTRSEGTDLSSAAGSPTRGTVHVQFCGSEPPGTYTVHGDGYWQAVPGVRIPYALPDSTFEVHRAATRTRLHATPLGAGRYALRVGVFDQRRHGFGPTQGAEVHLERMAHGRWHLVRHSQLMTDHGHAALRLRLPHGTKVRAATRGFTYYAGSRSRAVRLR